jgi:trans-2,3-dihydro-3-hydroxyanthranilate isomerase
LALCHTGWVIGNAEASAVISYALVDVFADRPFAGSTVAVFFEPIPDARHAVVAGELGHETAFLSITGNRYGLRIFHQVDAHSEELPFAGVPTLAAAWVLRDQGRHLGDALTLNTAVGPTPMSFEGDLVFLERPSSIRAGAVDQAAIAAAIGAEPRAIGWSGKISGASVALLPAFSSAGTDQLMIPVQNLDVMASLRPIDAIRELAPGGIYCFTPVGDGVVRARFFAAPGGVVEHPGTGSAAAALGGYLGDQIGPLDITIEQGVELGRSSQIVLRWSLGLSHVGGRVARVAYGVILA